MTQLRQSRWVSTVLVAVIALAWFGASNHCALAALEGLRKASHACCHEEQPSPRSTMQCCDTFHVTVPVHVAVPAAQLHALQPAWLEASAISVITIPVRVCLEFHATGPPRVFGFAENVLNRSLFSHAPPHFVA